MLSGQKTLWLNNNDNKEQYTIYRRRERGWERYGADVIRFLAQRRDEIEQLFFPFLWFSLSFASLFQLKDFSCGKCEMSFQLRCSPKPENTVNDFIHNNIEYNRIPTSSSRTRYTQTNHHPSHPFPADTSGCPSAFRTVRYSSLLAGYQRQEKYTVAEQYENHAIEESVRKYSDNANFFSFWGNVIFFFYQS